MEGTRHEWMRCKGYPIRSGRKLVVLALFLFQSTACYSPPSQPSAAAMCRTGRGVTPAQHLRGGTQGGGQPGQQHSHHVHPERKRNVKARKGKPARRKSKGSAKSVREEADALAGKLTSVKLAPEGDGEENSMISDAEVRDEDVIFKDPNVQQEWTHFNAFDELPASPAVQKPPRQKEPEIPKDIAELAKATAAEILLGKRAGTEELSQRERQQLAVDELKILLQGVPRGQAEEEEGEKSRVESVGAAPEPRVRKRGKGWGDWLAEAEGKDGGGRGAPEGEEG
eukprot:17666-Rhodomonas_salina.1